MDGDFICSSFSNSSLNLLAVFLATFWTALSSKPSNNPASISLPTLPVVRTLINSSLDPLTLFLSPTKSNNLSAKSSFLGKIFKRLLISLKDFTSRFRPCWKVPPTLSLITSPACPKVCLTLSNICAKLSLKSVTICWAVFLTLTPKSLIAVVKLINWSFPLWTVFSILAPKFPTLASTLSKICLVSASTSLKSCLRFSTTCLVAFPVSFPKS